MNPEEKHDTLLDVLPGEFSQEYTDTPAWRLRHFEVVRKIDARVIPWPGKQKNVRVWYVLANQYAVGWNENPSLGWSFPVRAVTNYQWSVWSNKLSQ
jgi:hypothetical protein